MSNRQGRQVVVILHPSKSAILFLLATLALLAVPKIVSSNLPTNQPSGAFARSTYSPVRVSMRR